VSPRRNAFDDEVVARVRHDGPVFDGRLRGACSIFVWFNAFVTIAVGPFSFAAFAIEGRSTARTIAVAALAPKPGARASASTGGASTGDGRRLAASPGTARVGPKM
jgi:hypothetical protein